MFKAGYQGNQYIL